MRFQKVQLHRSPPMAHFLSDLKPLLRRLPLVRTSRREYSDISVRFYAVAGPPGPSTDAKKIVPDTQSSQGQAGARPVEIRFHPSRLRNTPDTSKAPNTDTNKPAPDAATPTPGQNRQLGPFTRPGVGTATFEHNEGWDRRAHMLIGDLTNGLGFGPGFNLTRQHIEDFVTVAPTIAGQLTVFVKKYMGGIAGDYTRYPITDITDEAMTTLAAHCPKLKRCRLRGIEGLTDVSLRALVTKCPNINYIEATPHANGGNSFDGSTFELLESQPNLAPRLRAIRLDNMGTESYLEKAAALAKARPNLLLQLLTIVPNETSEEGVPKVDTRVYKGEGVMTIRSDLL
ncbi:hypothetical protein F4777DRAFT_15487 [Nemania sp. FL0916]|nr:hypothetical protein F4777DRAFT_15487 [Nemania sp. FL0916]